MKLALSGWKINLAILGIYALIAMITTYPMITGIIWSDLIPGAGHDEFYFLWHLWWIKHAILNLGTSPLYTTSIFHPQGGPLILASPLNEIIVTTLLPLILK